MNTKRKFLSAMFLSIALTGATVTAASAGGFLGDLAKSVGVPAQIVDPIEKMNAQTKVFEQVGGAVLQANGAPMSARCVTPVGIGYGPFLPIGGPCNVNGVWGVVQ